tara:strand:+ start:130 stop:486 length:357 start_codon:yes stop_codon:yes gene_type:complete
MKYFAKLDAANKVVAIHVLHDDVAPTEQAGMDFLNTTHKINNVWKQTFRDHSQRKHMACVDYTYDESRDAFIPLKPYPSWIFNESTCDYDAPVIRPDDEKLYYWDESTISWKEEETVI